MVFRLIKGWKIRTVQAKIKITMRVTGLLFCSVPHCSGDSRVGVHANLLTKFSPT